MSWPSSTMLSSSAMASDSASRIASAKDSGSPATVDSALTPDVLHHGLRPGRRGASRDRDRLRDARLRLGVQPLTCLLVDARLLRVQRQRVPPPPLLDLLA